MRARAGFAAGALVALGIAAFIVLANWVEAAYPMVEVRLGGGVRHRVVTLAIQAGERRHTPLHLRPRIDEWAQVEPVRFYPTGLDRRTPYRMRVSTTGGECAVVDLPPLGHWRRLIRLGPKTVRIDCSPKPPPRPVMEPDGAGGWRLVRVAR